MLSFTENFIDFYKDVQKIQAVLLATLSEKYPVNMFMKGKEFNELLC